MNPNEVSMHICNAPFCINTRHERFAWCGQHRWEREKYKVKPYKEFFPPWKPKPKKPVPYCPVKNKQNTIKYSAARKNSRLKKRYGIDFDNFQSLLLKQNSCCAICKVHVSEHESQKGKHFAVDHCHITNKVRGLLCYKCNMGLGYFNDNPILLDQALSYLSIKRSE